MIRFSLLPRSFPWMQFISGGSLLSPFVRGLFEGMFVLFLLMAAEEWDAGKNLVAPAPSKLSLGCFLGLLFCIQVGFNQTVILSRFLLFKVWVENEQHWHHSATG